LPKRRSQQTVGYDRDPRVVVLREMLAQYQCEVQGCSSARFQVVSGEYFVEVHHLLPLAEGGRDVLENTVALCPTHHGLLHHAKDRSEVLDQLQSLRASESKRG
jgi:predicted HNH restriction endonuclease